MTFYNFQSAILNIQVSGFQHFYAEKELEHCKLNIKKMFNTFYLNKKLRKM